MPKARKITLATSTRLSDAERATTSMSLPSPVHNRLDELVRLARDVKTTRAEIVAMLIAEAELDDADLEQRILRYRKLTVGDVVGSPADESVVISMHGPGRR